MRILIPYIILFILFSNCEEPFEESRETEAVDVIIVEGLLTNESKNHLIQISRPFSELNEEPEPVSNAVVILNGGEESALLEPAPDNPGYFISPVFRAVVGKVYTLGIFYQGREYYAQAFAEPGEPMKALNYSFTEDNLCRYEYTESNNPSMMEVNITWEENGNQKELFGRFFTLNVVDVNRLFAPEKEPLIFPRGAKIIRRQYSLSQPHQEFLRSYLSEIDWRGGGFDVAHGNVITNFTEGARGFFGVSMVSIDTSIIN